MARFDWDRETREARKRKHGSIPLWADPGAISLDDERELHTLLQPLVNVVNEFAELSLTQRRQRGSEFSYQLKRQADEICAKSAFANLTTQAVLVAKVEHLIGRLRQVESTP
jgi:hypothetical protein